MHTCTTSSRCISYKHIEKLDLEAEYENFSRTQRGGLIQREEERGEERERESVREREQKNDRWIYVSADPRWGGSCL